MVKKELTQELEFVDEGGYVDDARKILKVCKNLLLIGETGTGKTKLGHHMHGVMCKDAPLIEMTLGVDTNQWELKASDILVKGDSVVREGVVLMWLKQKKGILLINGFNYAPANVVSLFESLADWTNMIYIPELQKNFMRTPEHYLIVTMNPYEKVGYAGTHQLNIATLRRFEPIYMHYLSPMKETELVMRFYKDYMWSRKIVEFANKTRNLYKTGGLSMPLTTGNLINYAGLKALDMSDEKIRQIAAAHYEEGVQRDTVLRFWEQTEKEDVK